jgi:putative MFS transporter
MQENPVKDRLTPYQRKLFILLGVATFFEGYDMIALTQILPNLRAEFGISFEQGTLMITVINVGTILAFLLIRKADRWGRKRVLMVTIGGYTIFSLLSGLAPDVVAFTVAQLIARIFLIGEWAISMVYAAEEFPASRRGMVLGVLQGFSSLGSVVCAGLVPLMLGTAIGWRLVYFVGAVPLVLVMFARRGLRETQRFVDRANAGLKPPSLMAFLSSPYKKRMLQLAAIWFLTYLCTQNAITFWKEFAVAERGLTDGQIGLSITIAAVASMPFVFAAGKLLDRIGRRKGAVVIYLIAAAGCVLSYTLTSHAALTMALVLAIFGVSAVLPVLNSYNTELFPTELRGDAFSWSNNLLGRIGYVTSPLMVGQLAVHWGIGPAIASTAIFPIIALALIWLWLPETMGKELEETSAL